MNVIDDYKRIKNLDLIKLLIENNAKFNEGCELLVIKNNYNDIKNIVKPSTFVF